MAALVVSLFLEAVLLLLVLLLLVLLLLVLLLPVLLLPVLLLLLLLLELVDELVVLLELLDERVLLLLVVVLVGVLVLLVEEVHVRVGLLLLLLHGILIAFRPGGRRDLLCLLRRLGRLGRGGARRRRAAPLPLRRPQRVLRHAPRLARPARGRRRGHALRGARDHRRERLRLRLQRLVVRPGDPPYVLG